MALLIRNGTLMTMTEQGNFCGDLLISGGRIIRMAGQIADADGFGIDELDANGMTIMPGLVDIYVRDGGAEPAYVMELARNAGVSTAVLLPEIGQICEFLSSGEVHVQVCHIRPDEMTDSQLEHALHDRRDVSGVKCLVSIRDERQLRRVTEAAAGSEDVILSELRGCEKCCGMIERSGLSVVIGPQRTGIPWQMAMQLCEKGVPVAISSMYPAAQMKLLPVCAGLCVREGMPPETALRCVTRTPAALIGLEDRGRIAVGCRADLAIYDGDPLMLATSLVALISDGRIHHRTV